jgi:hypothetical protein
MSLLHRKSRWERVVGPVVDQTGLPRSIRAGIADPPKAVKSGVAAAGGVLGLTVGSAVVSSLRERERKQA